MSGTVLRVLTLIYSIQKQPLGIGVFPFIFPIFKNEETESERNGNLSKVMWCYREDWT